MRLARTLAWVAFMAMAVATTGATAPQVTPPPTPSATPVPSTTVPGTTPTSAAPVPTTTTIPATTPPTPLLSPSDATKTITLDSPSPTITITDGAVKVADSRSDDVTLKIRFQAMAVTKTITFGSLKGSIVKHLEINGLKDAKVEVEVTDHTFTELQSLTALAFTNVKYINSTVVIGAPASLSYLKLENTEAQDVSLEFPSTGESDLKQVDFVSNNFMKLPRLFYERKYKDALIINNNLNINGGSTELNQKEFENAQHNLATSELVSLQPTNCVSIRANTHVVCVSANADNVTTPTPPATTTDTAPVTTTTAPTLPPRQSTDTTLTVVVVVISVIAALLAYFVARRYFCYSSLTSSRRSARSPRLNERTVGLISKDDSSHHAAHGGHGGGGKRSFISSDDVLRPVRLEPQDVAITKSVGAGRLWIGDYQGRKVIIKRVEAESNDSYATKVLVTQARGLATLTHPHIVSLIGVSWVQGTDFGIVAEFMEKGTLKSVLMDLDVELDLHSKLRLCLDIAQALLHLHGSECDMYVKTLSSRKVLVNGAIACKLNLFECHEARSSPSNSSLLDKMPEVFGAGEMAWAAPELVLSRSTGSCGAVVLNPRKMNIFSLGVLICEIVTRVSPYQSEIDAKGHTRTDLDLAKRMRRQEKLHPHENRREFTELPAVLREMVERCLSYQPLLRPSVEEVVECLEMVKDYSERGGSTTSL